MYGNRIVLGSVVTTLNTKIAIFVLSCFVSTTMLGVYSFASFVGDGFFEIFYVFRAYMNTVVTNIYYNRSNLLLQRVVKKSIKVFYKIFAVLGFVLAVFYPLILIIFQIENHFLSNLLIFYILLTGIVIASAYIPFQFFFNQIGKPKEQTKFLAILFGITIRLNLSFIPFIGIFGAAAAIFLANLFQMVYLKQGIRNNIK